MITLKAYTVWATVVFLILAAILEPNLRIVLWALGICAGGVAGMMILLLPIFIA